MTTRNITNLDSNNDAHYLVPQIIYTGEISVEIIVNIKYDGITYDNSKQVLFGSINGATLIYVDFTINHIRGTLEGVDIPSMAFNNLGDGKLHKIVWARSVDTLAIYEDDVLLGAETSALVLSTVVIDVLSKWTTISTRNIDGQILSFKSWPDTARVGDPNRWYKLDEDWSTTTVADSGTDGANGTAVNLTPANSKSYTRNNSISPNRWESDTDTDFIEIAYEDLNSIVPNVVQQYYSKQH